MRKLLLWMIVLLVVGGVVFYFGWVQFQIPSNSYAVVFTKTGGWDSEPLAAGTFIWRWERLLPTNFRLHVYKVEPQRARVESSGILPSGDVYASALPPSAGSQVDFSYQVEADIRYVVRPEDLPKFAQEGLLPDDLEEWYSDLEVPLRETVVEAFAQAMSGRSGAPSVEALQARSRTMLEERFPSLIINAVSPRSTEFPDWELYSRAKSLYLEALESYESGVAEAERATAVAETQQESRIDLLRRYGEILSEYPVLLDYFTMSAERGIDPLQIEALRSATTEGR